MKIKFFFVETFFNDFTRVLKFAIITQLSFVAKIFHFRNEQSFTLNNCHNKVQIHKIINHK